MFRPLFTYPRGSFRVIVTIDTLADHRGFDLLFLAAEENREDLVKLLINFCDIKYTVGGRTAADIAYEKKYFDILLILLQANSRFPNDFRATANDTSIPIGLRRFILTSKNMQDAIRSQDKDEVLRLLNANPGLKFFFDTANNSALASAIRTNSFEIYQLLIERNLSLGPHEFFDELIKTLTQTQRTELRNITEQRFQLVADKHILILMSNTNVGPDDSARQHRLTRVCQALQRLNTIPHVKILLEIVAATRNFQITFDFLRDHVQFLNPKAEPYTNGLYSLSGKIYIGAKNLLDDFRAHEVLGVIAHEFCHFVMFKIFDNLANPYREDDAMSERTFRMISERSMALNGIESIIDSVFSLYESELHHAELIVRIPQILAHYIDQPERARELEATYAELSRYYNEECLPVMRQKLPEIEREAETRIRDEIAKPSKVLKMNRKSIIVILLSLILGLTSITLLILFMTIPCLFKSCGSNQDAFCENVALFTSACECHHNLTWDSGNCYGCLKDEQCSNDSICLNRNCEHVSDLFTCLDGKQKILNKKRCDFKPDCVDKSDEEYHCSK